MNLFFLTERNGRKFTICRLLAMCLPVTLLMLKVSIMSINKYSKVKPNNDTTNLIFILKSVFIFHCF